MLRCSFVKNGHCSKSRCMPLGFFRPQLGCKEVRLDEIVLFEALINANVIELFMLDIWGASTFMGRSPKF